MSRLTNSIQILFDSETRHLQYWHLDREKYPRPLLEISLDTLSDMSFSDAAKFIGERVLLRMPAMRELYKDYLWSDDGQTPPKKQ